MKAIEKYGDRAEIKELGYRLQSLIPGAQKLTESEANAVAQIALIHGLDPFNGEVWGLKGYSKKNNKIEWYGVMVGIKGLRKCARRKMSEEGGVYWVDFRRVDPKEYGEPDESIVWAACLKDTITLNAWKDTIHEMTSIGIDYQEVIKMVGPAPEVVGVGIVEAGESSRMKPNALAKKRAEADALKQRFDVDFGGLASVSDEEPGPYIQDPGDVVEGDFSDEVVPDVTPIDEDKILEELGYAPDVTPIDESELKTVGIAPLHDKDWGTYYEYADKHFPKEKTMEIAGVFGNAIDAFHHVREAVETGQKL